MIVIDILRTAMQELTTNKMRTGLTMMGIIIGVGAVIALMAAGQGAQQGITQQVRGLGSNLIFVTPGETEGGGGFGISATTLTTDDVEALQGNPALPYVESAVSIFRLELDTQVVGNGQNTSAGITATEAAFTDVRSYEVEVGRFINEEDERRRSSSVVLGATVASELFDSPDQAFGEEVRISFGGGRLSFNLTVVGIMEERGASGSGNDDTQLYMPLSTFIANIPFGRSPTGEANVSEIVVKVTESGKLDETKAAVANVILERHDFAEDFIVETQDDLLSTARQVSRTLTILLGAIAGISLVVGGIGIMNIMLVSVTERTREIGIRKAVGASHIDIMLQFVIEAVLVTMLGGVVGIVAGVAAASAANGQDFGTGTEITTIVTTWSVVIAFGVSALIGLFFGIYPALQASRLDPIEALRSE
ncbi:MAG: ABC transporter permease [Chloroflexi bacterium]|nr:ABC transporter permease [Chloroflexota bacterium]MCI0855439.1 ABC transporter permease [Chloroflexota bacterium]MCI0889801.1 ABC transporter permease [Chloroflexota bacterium]